MARGIQQLGHETFSVLKAQAYRAQPGDHALIENMQRRHAAIQGGLYMRPNPTGLP
jgi:hypothetical protein